ncbi:MAG: hypothetical protein HN904_07160 [Victivallales bacterium]|nr:hypothetical protein [Victivallales bacterium]MBT7162542.1 hypothetical protein [Victivallales bacterium]
MSQRLTPRFLMYAVLVILVATGLSSTVGFRRIVSLIDGRVGAKEAMHAHGRMATALDEQMQLLLVLLERPLTPAEHDALDRTLPTFETELAAAAARERAEELGLGVVRKAWLPHRAKIREILALDARPAPGILGEALASSGTLSRATSSFVLRRELDVSALRELIRRTAWQYVLLAVGLASLGMVVALLFHFRFTHFVRRPIEQVTDFLRSDSSLGQRLSVKGDAVVVELVRVCNEHFEDLERRTEDHWRELRAERRIATALIESVPGPAVLVNPAGEPLRANAAARELLTSPKGEEVSRELQRLVSEGIPAEETPYAVEIRAVAAPGEFSGSLVRLRALPTETAADLPSES